MSIIIKNQFIFCNFNNCVNDILFFPIPLSPIIRIISNKHISVREVFKCTIFSFITIRCVITICIIFIEFKKSSSNFPVPSQVPINNSKVLSGS